MTVKPKWKVFSIRQCFSTEFTTAEAQTLFDALMELDNSLELDKYFKDHNDLVPWHPFEFMADMEFVEHIQAQAQYAQETEELR